MEEGIANLSPRSRVCCCFAGSIVESEDVVNGASPSKYRPQTGQVPVREATHVRCLGSDDKDDDDKSEKWPWRFSLAQVCIDS